MRDRHSPCCPSRPAGGASTGGGNLTCLSQVPRTQHSFCECPATTWVPWEPTPEHGGRACAPGTRASSYFKSIQFLGPVSRQRTLHLSRVLALASMTSSTIPIELPGQVGFLATATLCMVLPTALVVLRILARRRTSLSLNGSDFCIVAALVCHPSQALSDFYWPSCPVRR